MQIDFLSLIQFYNVFENVEFYFDIQEDQTLIDEFVKLLATATSNRVSLLNIYLMQSLLLSSIHLTRTN
jgi:hypothetical protein